MEILVARQPIFNIHNEVIAYELLFRNNHNNIYNNTNDDLATLEVITNSFFTIGIKNITLGKKAFVNFTENLLINEVPSIISPDLLTIEILETVEPSDEIIAKCKKLKNMGYTIALDDFVFHEKYETLIKLADIIKVDFILTKGAERKNIVDRLSSTKIKFLAEKVETLEDFNEAKAYGYSYFQGYYFCEPLIIEGNQVEASKLTTLKIIQQLNSSEINFENLEDIILKNAYLSYKLLKIINSSAYGFKSKINKIKTAITLLGEKEIVKWLYIVLIEDLAIENNDELINCSLIRAKFSEIIAIKTNNKDLAFKAYLTGILSLTDVFLNRPIEDIVDELFLSQEVKDALTGKSNFLRSILDLIIAYENADWDKVIWYCENSKISEDTLYTSYLEAINWAKTF